MRKLPPASIIPTVLKRSQPRVANAGPRPGKYETTVAALVLSYPWRPLVVGAGVILVIAVLSASQGSVRIPPLTVFEILVSKLPLIDITPSWPDTWDTILWQLRLPRIALAGLVGAALATAGATYQGLFRNPLADPYLLGAASGAGLAATVVLLTGVPVYIHGVTILPVAAFTGAVAAVATAYMIARQSDGVPLVTMILAGVAIASLTQAVTSLLMIRSDPDLRPVLGWVLGGFTSAQWKHSAYLLPYLIPSLILAMSYSRILNIFQLDDEQALQLGVNVERTKVLLIAAATLSTAAAVSFSGIIGFVGLVAPHAVRLIWGADYRFLLPMSAIVGAAFLILADLVARTVASPTELPVGIVTAFCGAPFLLYLLKKRRPVAM